MGKINSVIEFTGRTGNLVGVKGQNGQVYLRKHVRKIHNDNSEQQVVARAKMALAGNLSKLIKAELLYGMPGNGRRMRRQRWMTEILRRMTTTTVDGTVKAILAPSDMILSEGRYSFGVKVENAAIAEEQLTMSITLPDNVEKLLVVAIYADSVSSNFNVVGSAMAESSGSFSMPLPDASYHSANLYVIPIANKTEPSGVTYGGDVEATEGATSSYATAASSYNSDKFEWMHSIFVGTITAA